MPTKYEILLPKKRKKSPLLKKSEWQLICINSGLRVFETEVKSAEYMHYRIHNISQGKGAEKYSLNIKHLKYAEIKPVNIKKQRIKYPTVVSRLTDL